MSKKSKQRRNAALAGNGEIVSKTLVTATREVTREFSDKVPAKEPYVYKPCAKSHPALDLGGGLVIYGGAASSPVVHDADIYVSLDYGKSADPKAYPWNGGQFIYFPITDMSAPSNPDEFKKMVSWLAEQIKAGHKVHVGCIGGHGRTGTVFAALVKEMTGNVEAIQYVRKNYCNKAVESASQVEFLVKHYGVAKAKGTKSYESYSSSKGSKKSFYDRYPETWVGNIEHGQFVEGTATSFVPRGSGGDGKRFNELYVAPAATKEKDVAVVDPTPKRGNVWGLDPAEEPAPAGVVGID